MSNINTPRTPARSRRLKHGTPRLQALEQRMMFDGAAVADAAAAAAASEHNAADTAAKQTVDASAFDAPAAVAQEAPAAPAAREIVFIDATLPNARELAGNVKAGAEVVLIDSGHDGLLQIDAALQGRSDIEAIHIVSHGATGHLQLGTAQLDSSTLQSNAELLRSIGSHLSGSADILLYGCDIAQGDGGAQFIAQLADATGADVAASTDATGSTVLGGNWALEAHAGVIEASALNFVDGAHPFLLATPVVSSVDDITYTEGSGPVVVDSSISVTSGTSYDGKYVRFSLTNGQNTDVLGLNSAANVNAAGAISVSGASVYLGSGSAREIIGTIDATENGQAGKALKITFVSTFTNSGFETGTLAGWTAMNQVIDLGATSIAGFVSPQDTTYPSGSGGNDNDVPTTAGSFTTPIVTDQKTEGSYALRLLSSGMTTRNGYDVVHGPAVYSDVFAASAGDAIYFDWRALAGGDAYDVYGYILNTTTGATTQVLDATGNSTNASTAWATASTTIPTGGNYRFVFVSGTYDFSGGKAAGASLYIDNVRVYGSKVNDAVVTSIARQVTFEATSDNPVTASTRVFTVTAVEANGLVGSDTGLINMVATNDAPTLGGAAQVLNYTENAAVTAIDSAITVVDPDGPATNFNGGYFQAQISVNGLAEDRVSVIHTGTGAGQIGVAGSNITYGGTVIGTLDAGYSGMGSNALRINLNASANAAAVQALARSIGYSNSSDTPSTSARTVSYLLNDGGNTGGGALSSAIRTATVNVAAVDDPAVLTLTRASANYSENDAGFFVDAGLTLTDVDTTTMNGAKIVIAGGFLSAEDRLQPASGTNADGISYSYDAAKGVLTLSGSATIAQYQAALRAVKYANLSENPNVGARTITITLGSAVALDINGVTHYYEAVTSPLYWTAAKSAAETRSFQGLTGYLATLTSQAENDFVREKLTADAWIGASDDYLYINAATGTTTYANQAAAEGHWYWVTGPDKGTRISDGNGSPVTASGSYAYWNTGEPNNSGGENYGEVYSTGASLGRWNDLPNGVALAYVVEYTDSAGTANFSKSITVTPVRVNDAPVLTGGASLAGINEDALSNSGTLVGSLLSASDPDVTAVTGIAINALTSSRGTWQFSLDNGANWSAVGSVSDASALLLRSTDRVRFVPDGNNADTASFNYRAWDRSDENGGTRSAGVKADVATNGGTAAYSSGTQSAGITVTAVNDAPVLSAAAPTLASITEDVAAPAGTAIGTLLGSSVADVDSGAAGGIAVTGLTSGNGTWEYSTNAGSSWAAVGTVAVNNALLLRSNDQIRFKPDGKNATSASFSYKAWDQASGSYGSKADASTGGGTTAFSTAGNVASINVTAVNDAPVLSGAALNFAGLSEDDTASAGQTVASLLQGTLSDVDAAALQGIAVTGSTVAGSGRWQYSLNGGSSWTDLGSVSGASAKLLAASDLLRFVPDSYVGGTATLTLRGWDQTSGSAGSNADTTGNGGSTAFSSATATASIVVAALDDAPEITTPADAATFTENGIAVAVGTSLALRDDSGQLRSASVRIATGFTQGDMLAVGTPGSLSVAYNSATGILTLSGSASTAVYQTALRSVSYTTASEDPTVNAATRTLDWSLTDSGGNAGTTSHTILSVTPLADAPAIGGTPATWDYTEDDGTRVLAPSLTLADADDTQLSGATVTITGNGYFDDGLELLAAFTTGTSITASFDGSTGTLTLTGTDSAANYQKVLRSVTYANTRDYNNPSAVPSNDFALDGSTNARNFSWQVTDADSDGVGATASFAPDTALTLHDANETPQVANVQGNAVHIGYTESGGATTLEGVLSVLDDGVVSTINAAVVRVTVGLADGDELGFYNGVPGWVQSGTATSGTLSLGGTEISYSWSLASGDMTLTTTGGTADQADYTAVMQQVGFISHSDDPSASGGSRTLIWRVTDSGGLQSAVTAAQTTIIDITAVNDTASVNGASLPADGDIVFIENGPGVVLAPSLSLADPDDTQIASATVAISGAGFSAGNEYLSLPGASAGASADWSVPNVSGSGIAASYDWASGTLSLSGTASLAAYETVMRQVQYGSVDNDPTAIAATRTIAWTLTDSFGSRLTDADGGGNDYTAGSAGATATSTVTLAPRNDAPVLAGLGGSVSYTEGGSAVTLAGAMSLADADDTVMSQARVFISGGFTAGDTLAVTNAGGLSTSYDAATGVLTLSGAASTSTYRTALRSVCFSSTSDDPTAAAASRTLSWQLTDGNAAGDGALASAIGSSTVTITAADDAASIGGLPAAHAISYTENGSTVVVAPSLTLSDADDSTLASASVTISAGLSAGDLLAVGADLSGTGINAVYAAGTLTLTGQASVADFEQVLRSVTFRNSGEDPTGTAATRTLSWSTVSSFGSRSTDADGANDVASGATATAVTSTLDITALNDAPVLSLVSGSMPMFEQGGGATYVVHGDNTPGGVTLSDPDLGDSIASASVVISADRLASDTLSVATPAGWSKVGNVYSGAGASITVTYTTGTGTLSFSGTGSRSAYDTLLGHVQFDNGSAAPTASAASRELTWTVTDNNSAGDGARSANATSLLVIRDRNDAPGITPPTLSANYTEGAAAVSLAGFTIADPDPDEVVTATMTLSLPAAGTLTTAGGASYDAVTGVWTLTGSVASVNAALAAAQFIPAGDNDVDATLTLLVADGGEDGAATATATLDLHVTAVNDAPVLTAVAPVLPPLTEDDIANSGFSVASFRGNIDDVDSGALPGIAITALASGNGAWQYSLDGGANWLAAGTINATSALVLGDTDRLRFVPNGANATTAGFTYRAWDGTGGAIGAKLNASSTGNATPFSNIADIASISVTAVNDAPVLAADAPVLTNLSEDQTGNTGHSVASILGTSASDVDSGAQSGIAITSTDTGNGAWQYSLDGGSNWSSVGGVSAGSARLLRGSDLLRFVPDAHNATSAGFGYRAWDQTSGSAGGLGDTSVNGGTSAYSASSNGATIAVTAVNDAPVLAADAPVLTGIDENAIDNPGQTVASFVGATISDVDSGALPGIALTGSTDGNGAWQYSLDDGTTWTAIGALSPSQSLLLRTSDKIRFVPDAQNATSATLSYRAWDRTSGNAGDSVATTINGDTTAYSDTANTASISVSAVNDASINDLLPTVSGAQRADGSVRQDGVLTALPGTWHDVDQGAAAPSFSYQWQVADDAAGTNLRSIDGATAATLLLTDAQVGTYVRVRVVASDGVEPSLPAFSVFQQVTNLDPLANVLLENQRATEAVPYSYTLPDGAFRDANGEDTLHYTATLADGSPLPDWLHFDAMTRTFSGTPDGGDIGTLNVRVTADDLGGHPASANFEMAVAGVPQAAPAGPALPPEAGVAPPPPFAGVTVPPPFVQESSNGIATPDTFLPSSSVAFVSGPLIEPFRAPEMVLIGEGYAPSLLAGSEFSSGYTRAEGFQIVVPKVSTTEALLTVSNIPDAVLRNVAEPMKYTLAPDTFTHTRLDAVVRLMATRTDGSALPSWMRFDARTGSFAGVPPVGAEGDVEVLVTARDNFGNATQVLVKIRIGKETNAAPAKPSLSSQLRMAGEAARQADRLKLVEQARQAASAARP